MKIVAITSCVTGIAHTYMAVEAIRKECKKKGYVCKVETQRALGVENKLSERDIKAADPIISTNDVGVSKAEHFDAYEDKIARHTPRQVIQKLDITFETLK